MCLAQGDAKNMTTSLLQALFPSKAEVTYVKILGAEEGRFHSTCHLRNEEGPIWARRWAQANS